MKTNRLAFPALVALAFAAVTMLGGCNMQNMYGYNTEDEVTGYSVRQNNTPEISSIGRTWQQRLDNRHKATNETMREFYDDWDAFWFKDAPLGLTTYPMP